MRKIIINTHQKLKFSVSALNFSLLLKQNHHKSPYEEAVYVGSRRQGSSLDFGTEPLKTQLIKQKGTVQSFTHYLKE